LRNTNHWLVTRWPPAVPNGNHFESWEKIGDECQLSPKGKRDADTVNFSLFMVDKDGKEQPMVKITYKRKK
jgi:hypothetical protein